MTHIGVRQRRLFGNIFFLPFDTVVSATGEGIRIRARRADVTAAGSAEVGGAHLDEKSTVENTVSSGTGRLMLVAVHPNSGELSYLVEIGRASCRERVE